MFDKDMPTTNIQLLNTVLKTKLSENDSLLDHLTEFRNNWDRLAQRGTTYTAGTAADATIPQVISVMTSSLATKGAFLLCFLPPSMDNIVDNLMTKDNLTYDDIYSRLITLGNDRRDNCESKAYYGNHDGKKDDGSTLDYCTWCKSRKEKRYQGHNHTNCQKLAAYRNKKKQKKQNA